MGMCLYVEMIGVMIVMFGFKVFMISGELFFKEVFLVGGKLFFFL